MGLWNTRRSGLNQTEQVKLSKIVLKATNNKTRINKTTVGISIKEVASTLHIITSPIMARTTLIKY